MSYKCWPQAPCLWAHLNCCSLHRCLKNITASTTTKPWANNIPWYIEQVTLFHFYLPHLREDNVFTHVCLLLYHPVLMQWRPTIGRSGGVKCALSNGMWLRRLLVSPSSSHPHVYTLSMTNFAVVRMHIQLINFWWQNLLWITSLHVDGWGVGGRRDTSLHLCPFPRQHIVIVRAHLVLCTWSYNSIYIRITAKFVTDNVPTSWWVKDVWKHLGHLLSPTVHVVMVTADSGHLKLCIQVVAQHILAISTR